MPFGPDRTFETLVSSNNLAALDLLLELFLHGPEARRDSALEALLARSSRDVQLGLIARFHLLSDRHQVRILAEGSRLSGAVRAAYVDPDPTVYRNACTLIRQLHDYDQSPLILGSLLGKDPARKADAERLFEDLTNELIAESALPAEARSQHDIEGARQRFLGTLRQGMRRFAQHQADVVPLAFLMLADADAQEVLRIVREGSDPGHRAMVQVLRTRSDALVLRWVYRLLETLHPPTAALTLFAERDDRPFVEYLLDNAAMLAEPMIQASLRRVHEVRWLDPRHPVLDDLEEERQFGLVVFAVHAGIPLERKIELIAWLLDVGKPRGRRAAACALAQIQGNDANQLILACLEDADPEVRVAVIPLLRQRGIPNVMGHLIALLDHPEPMVQQAVRGSLSDLSFARYISTYDQMQDPTRRALGVMMLRIDPNARQTLRDELATRHRQHRMRAARIVRLLELHQEFLSDLMALLADADRLVRREAIEVFAGLDEPGIVEELARPALDPAHQMHQGAREALDHLRREARHASMREAAQRLCEQLPLAPKP